MRNMAATITGTLNSFTSFHENLKVSFQIRESDELREQMCGKEHIVALFQKLRP